MEAKEISNKDKLNSEDYIKNIITAVMQKFMGKALDYARISGMSDRSFSQFQKSLKDDCYNIIVNSQKILEEFKNAKK